jgi:unsaturated rhamnogalacturonyl hydrolase
MKTPLPCIGLGILLAIGPCTLRAEVMTKEQIIADAEKMADAQLALLEKKKSLPKPDWEMGVLWAGMADFSKISQKPQYLEALIESGEKEGWKPIVSYPKLALEKRMHASNADDLCIGQAWLSVYEQNKNPAILEGVKERITLASDFILDDPAKLAEIDRRKADMRVWTWCDALFMAPAVHSHLSALTGDAKYREAMHAEWWRTSEVMYDEEEHLFFRDEWKLFPRMKTQSGNKVFWARGNGWVLGGLARVMEYLPKDDPLRPKYEEQFRQMATKLASLQRPDGTWSPSLLDFEEFPYSETSGTALNTFAMAWGINHGLLDEKIFRPVIEKAWAALLAARRPDGMLGYVQAVAHGPGPNVYAENERTYATGAFLMTAAQLVKLAPLNLPPVPTLTAAVKPPPVVKVKNEVPATAAADQGAGTTQKP